MEQRVYETLVAYIVENQDRLYRVAYYYVNNRDNARDVVQNAICKALENYGSIRSHGALRTWMERILINESMNYLRKYRKETLCEYALIQEEAYVESAYDRDFSVLEAVRRLPAGQRTVIMLRFYDELTLKEISQVTGMNLNTVKTRLYNGLRTLRGSVGR